MLPGRFLLSAWGSPRLLYAPVRRLSCFASSQRLQRKGEICRLSGPTPQPQYLPHEASRGHQMSFWTRTSLVSEKEEAKTGSPEVTETPKDSSEIASTMGTDGDESDSPTVENLSDPSSCSSYKEDAAAMSDEESDQLHSEAEEEEIEKSKTEEPAKKPEKEPEKGGFSAVVKEKEAKLKNMDRLVAEAKQKVLTNLAEVENIRGRTRRDADSIKKHAIEKFAKSLLDVVDNLGRTASSVPENYRNETLSKDDSNYARLLRSLFEGVDMTEKQLMKIFSKHGVQKFEPVGEKFDSMKHFAMVEIDDVTKEPRTVASVIRAGYLFNDKILRQAEVGVVKRRAEKPKEGPTKAASDPAAKGTSDPGSKSCSDPSMKATSDSAAKASSEPSIKATSDSAGEAASEPQTKVSSNPAAKIASSDRYCSCISPAYVGTFIDSYENYGGCRLIFDGLISSLVLCSTQNFGWLSGH